MRDIHLLISGVGAFAISVAALFALRPIAYAVNLLDRPGGHKTHHGVVPIVGGLGMLFGVLFGVVSQPGALGPLQQYLFSAILLVVVGMLDDRFDLAPGLRLVAQFSAVLPMFFGAGVRLTSFGDLLGLGPLDVAPYSLVATVVVTMAAINAFNMLDGLDGLAGGIALVSAGLMLAVFGRSADPGNAYLLAALCGAIGGFLLFNMPVQWNRGVRCFMGDAGSTLLGFTLAWVTIGSSQGPLRMASPVAMVWLVAVPATDLVWTVLRRLARGQSPAHPDNEHLHHMLLRAGFGVRAVFVILIGIALLLASVGLYLDRARTPDWESFALLLVSGAALAFTCSRIHGYVRSSP